jgi:Zn-dependent protease with chaperone function
LPALPPVAYDPINAIDLAFLRTRAQAALAELVQNLPPLQQARVNGIPLVPDDEVGEVNAFAACTAGGKSLMAVSDGMLDVTAHLAQARAIDELFGQRKVDEYVAFVARNQRPKQPLVRPPPGFFDPNQTVDGRKVQRQHQVLDEELAFILGHELAHHYLGHLPCTAGNVTASEVAHVLSGVIPALNQPNELAADMAGVNNVLTTGSHRQAYRYTEVGALLTMQFFGGLDQLSAVDIVFGFERSHPPPAVRIPVIQQTAATFRATGGQGLPIFGF